jgi:hypothetical protein
MERAALERMEQELDGEVRKRFPGAPIQRVAILQYGDDPEVEPGELLARIILEGRATGKGASGSWRTSVPPTVRPSMSCGAISTRLPRPVCSSSSSVATLTTANTGAPGSGSRARVARSEAAATARSSR